MNVTIAVRVFSSEALMALIRHYRLHPGPQADAVKALNLPHQLVSKLTSTLTEAGVVIPDPPSRGRRAGHYRVDQDRVDFLLREMRDFVAGAGEQAPSLDRDSPASS